MPTKTYTHPFSFGNGVPLDFHTFAIRRKLPAWRVCEDPKPPFILDPNTNWNCAKCTGEKLYYLPVNISDKFEFQFQFDDVVNEDPTVPEMGWQESGGAANTDFYMKAKIVNCDCTPIEDLDFVDLIAEDWGVAFDEDAGSLQWLRIDVGLIPVEVCCFLIQVEQWSADAAVTIITAGPFVRNDTLCARLCEPETILICGSYKKADCWGRRYDIEIGAGGDTFQDCVRLEGEVVQLGTTSESVFDGEVEIKTSMRKRYRLDLGGMPPIIAEWLSNILASNSELTIGDYIIDRKNGDTVGSFDQSQKSSQMFHGSVEFSILCEIDNFGCE